MQGPHDSPFLPECPLLSRDRRQLRSIAYILLVHELTIVLHQYFSSLERLRLAEDGKTSLRPSSRRLATYPPNSPSASIKAAASFTIVTNSFIQPGLLINGRRLRRRRNSAADITPNTIAWFASLSPAVQRKLFSKEECSFYSQEKHTAILDAADETLHRRSWHPLHFAEFKPRTSVEDDTIVDVEKAKDDECDDGRVDSAVDMGDYSLDGFRWLNDASELDLKLNDYHQAIAETNRRTTPSTEPAKRRSRRNPSISSISTRHARTSTSSIQPQIEALPSPPTLPVSRPHSRSTSFSFKHLRHQGSVSSIDPTATHYQDPAARMKLRLYLASPQKFDEAIEFGFPSVQNRNQLTRPMTSPQPRSEVNRTFFVDDTPELSGDDDDEPEEPDTRFDPRTPDDPIFQMNRTSRKGSIDGVAKARPFPVPRPTDSYARGLPSNREMTLHMTLTRPDLRSPEELQQQSGPPKVNKLPLGKAELPAEADPVSVWDTLPLEESKMKRFLRKLKLK